MAAHGFIELLRLADQARQKHEGGREAQDNRWSGIAFSLAGFQFVAPLGEIAGVLQPPIITPVPNTKSWFLGLANVRGRLLPISDLSVLLTEHAAKNQLNQQQKILIINSPGNYSGFLVEHVAGLQHFNKHSYFSVNHSLPASIAACTQGYFDHDNRHWHVFMFSRLLQNPEFLNIAI